MSKRYLISLYAQGEYLYYHEEIDGKRDIRREKYDGEIEAAANMPSSHAMTLPTNQDELNYYSIVSIYGKYAFERTEANNGGRLTYIRKPEYEVDVFVLDNKFILHIQTYKETTKEDEVVNKIFKEFDFQNKTPEDFCEYFSKKLEESELKILDGLEDLDFSTVPVHEVTAEIPEQIDAEKLEPVIE